MKWAINAGRSLFSKVAPFHLLLETNQLRHDVLCRDIGRHGAEKAVPNGALNGGFGGHKHDLCAENKADQRRAHHHATVWLKVESDGSGTTDVQRRHEERLLGEERRGEILKQTAADTGHGSRFEERLQIVRDGLGL